MFRGNLGFGGLDERIQGADLIVDRCDDADSGWILRIDLDYLVAKGVASSRITTIRVEREFTTASIRLFSRSWYASG